MEDEEINKALKLLEESGYYVGNLWHINDIQSKFECDEDEAIEILDKAVAGEWIIEQINDRIYRYCDEENFTQI